MAKAQAQEPSMEEILASIRRIIADEEKPVSKAVAPPPASQPEPEPEPEPAADHVSEDDLDRLFASASEPGAEEDDDILDLTEAEVADLPPLIEGLSPEEADIQFTDPEPVFVPEPVRAPPPPPPPPRPAAVRPPPPPPPPPPKPRFEPRYEPVAALEEEPAERIVSETTDHAVAAAFDSLSRTIVSRNARTLEDLVQDMLRPMLKAWLDQNLPPMVERLVRAEIERVTRGGR